MVIRLLDGGTQLSRNDYITTMELMQNAVLEVNLACETVHDAMLKD